MNTSWQHSCHAYSSAKGSNDRVTIAGACRHTLMGYIVFTSQHTMPSVLYVWLGVSQCSTANSLVLEGSRGTLEEYGYDLEGPGETGRDGRATGHRNAPVRAAELPHSHTPPHTHTHTRTHKCFRTTHTHMKTIAPRGTHQGSLWESVSEGYTAVADTAKSNRPVVTSTHVKMTTYVATAEPVGRARMDHTARTVHT
jgi:hypothetical protein